MVGNHMTELMTKKFDWSKPIHDHVTSMANLAAKIKGMGMEEPGSTGRFNPCSMNKGKGKEKIPIKEGKIHKGVKYFFCKKTEHYKKDCPKGMISSKRKLSSSLRMTESKDVTLMKIEELQSSLEAHELRLIERNPMKKAEQALKAIHKDDDRRNDKKWKRKQSLNRRKTSQEWSESSDKRGRSKLNYNQKKFDKSKVECFNCHKLGYYSYECGNEKNKQSRHKEEALTTQEDSDSEPLNLMVTDAATNSHSEFWYLDSGCSNHMTNHKEWLKDLDSTKRSRVKFADDSSLSAEGAGSVVIKRKNGSKAIVSNVLCVPKMKYNLLSIGQLIEKGFSVLMKNSQLELFDSDGKLILRTKASKNRTFQVSFNAAEVQCMSSVETRDESWIWHSRLGHLNFKSLHQLGTKQMVSGLPITTLPEKIV
ncbi:PREDICTED: uncharacterized protein LOC109356505 [Lupinus angustifolius]|uniref:uncharacterized protein LOC109356505 n=1 Tax=Lupinus angustifolius TaxID=3871 RepID=UPI00092E5867|nr:PREDICTED: uncharacterized protein LOC109356505 [Lupinus angustifolius]